MIVRMGFFTVFMFCFRLTKIIMLMDKKQCRCDQTKQKKKFSNILFFKKMINLTMGQSVIGVFLE